MLTGYEITKEFLKFIHNKYGNPIPDIDEEIDNDFRPNDQLIFDLQAETVFPDVIKQLLLCFRDENVGSQFNSSFFACANRIEIIDFNDVNFKKRNRPFSMSDTQFGYLSIKYLLNFNSMGVIMRDTEGYKSLVDFIGSALILKETKKLNDFIQYIVTGDLEKGLLIYKTANTESVN